MLGWLARKADSVATAREIYGSSVTAARHETFYTAWGVPDTPEGRLEMLLLHLALTLDRLDAEGGAAEPLRRRLTENFVSDMDDNFREMGVGDLTVPKRVKKAAAALYDRHRDYAAALALPDDSALATTLATTIGVACAAAPSSGLQIDRIAVYARATAVRLAAQSVDDIAAGRIHFAAPEFTAYELPAPGAWL